MTVASDAGVPAWRHGLGRVGVWLFSGALEADPGGVAGHLERLGYPALWVGGGNPDPAAFRLLESLLEASDRLVVATGITNLWAWEPAALAEAAARLEAAHPGRFVLGIGVSHAPLVERMGRRYERPYQAMVAYLDALDALDALGTGGRAETPPRVLAALGERMLALSATRAAGAHPYLTPPAHTAAARVQLGAGPLLAPEQAVVLDPDPSRARATARAYLERYLGLPNYANNLRRLGYGDDDLAGGGSEALVDALVCHGGAAEVAGGVLAHLEAGADHVCVQPLAAGGGVDLDALEALAPHLLGGPTR